jgi:hypothetical protein
MWHSHQHQHQNPTDQLSWIRQCNAPTGMANATYMAQSPNPRAACTKPRSFHVLLAAWPASLSRVLPGQSPGLCMPICALSSWLATHDTNHFKQHSNVCSCTPGDLPPPSSNIDTTAAALCRYVQHILYWLAAHGAACAAPVVPSQAGPAHAEVAQRAMQEQHAARRIKAAHIQPFVIIIIIIMIMTPCIRYTSCFCTCCCHWCWRCW